MAEFESFVIFNSPLDYPGKYVVRRFVAKGGESIPDDEPLAVAKTYDRALDSIPGGLYRIPRDPADHASVVEVWI